MNLSSDLISQFVKVTKDEKKTSTGVIVYGTTVVRDGSTYVKLDGSDLLTPVVSTAAVEDNERVTVLVKDHTATITGNTTTPSASSTVVAEQGGRLEASEINVDILIAEGALISGRLEASEAEIGELVAHDVTITGKLEASEAEIEKIKAEKLDVTSADIKYATIGNLEAVHAEIYDLTVTHGDFVDLTTQRLKADEADIIRLDAEKASIDYLEANYADIEFANIDEAAIRRLFADTGIIKDLVISDGQITGELAAVTIKGDLIEAGTLKTDRLIIKGTDGKYYALHTDFSGITGVEPVEEDKIHGSILVAKSITANKIAVEDLVAFGATIAGFNIVGRDEEKPARLYSGVKSTVDNPIEGIYMDEDGQFHVGDGDNFIKYYKGEDDAFKLEISASEINLKASNIHIGARNLIRNSDNLIFSDYYFADAVSSVLGIGELGLFTLSPDDETEMVESEEVEVVEETEVVESEDEYTYQGFKDGMKLHDYHLIKMEDAIIKALSTGVPTARITTISLPASGWTGSGTIYSQAVTMSEVTANSKVDLLPSPEQLNELLLAEISLTAANSNGAITVFALGDAPSSDLELQAMITEVIMPEVSA